MRDINRCTIRPGYSVVWVGYHGKKPRLLTGKVVNTNNDKVTILRGRSWISKSPTEVCIYLR